MSFNANNLNMNEREILGSSSNNLVNYFSFQQTSINYQETPIINEHSIESFNNQEIFVTNRKRNMVLIGLSLALFLTTLDQAIVSICLTKIASDFHALSYFPWIGTAFLLSSTVLQPLYRKFSKIFGRKDTFLFSVSTFLCGSIFSSASMNMPIFILSRVIVGIGNGGIISLVNDILTDIVPSNEHGKYQVITLVTYALSSILGPLIGGSITDHASWRWVFYLNIPIGLSAILIVKKFLRLPHVYGFLKEKLLAIDYLGTFVFIAAVVSTLLPLNWGGIFYAWSSFTIISLFIFSLMFFLLFILIELKVAEEPLIKIHIFKLRNSLLIFLSSFCIGITFFGFMYFLPLYFQVVKGENVMEAGFQLVPLACGLAIFSVSSGFATTLRGKFKPWITMGFLMVSLGAASITTFNETTVRGKEICALLIVGAGFGCSMEISVLSAQSSVDHIDHALVTSLVGFFRLIGGIFGIAILSSIFNNSFQKYLLEILPPNIKLSEVMNSIDYMKSLPFDIQADVIHAYVQSLSMVTHVLTIVALSAVVFSLFLKQVPIRRTVLV
ncbi:hypothetical protein G9A89_011549 [Geosiphon pyriformis]|nr:hypothetical protein G9A89_011549 [Geosiphon pyriformis]